MLNKQTNKQTLNRYRAENERLWLVEHLPEIRNVEHWAIRVGSSRQRLYRLMKCRYNQTPNQILTDERYKKICFLIQASPEATADDVAGRTAPHWNQNRLCNFLCQHYGTTFTRLRVDVLNGSTKKKE